MRTTGEEMKIIAIREEHIAPNKQASEIVGVCALTSPRARTSDESPDQDHSAARGGRRDLPRRACGLSTPTTGRSSARSRTSVIASATSRFDGSWPTTASRCRRSRWTTSTLDRDGQRDRARTTPVVRRKRQRADARKLPRQRGLGLSRSTAPSSGRRTICRHPSSTSFPVPPRSISRSSSRTTPLCHFLVKIRSGTSWKSAAAPSIRPRDFDRETPPSGYLLRRPALEQADAARDVDVHRQRGHARLAADAARARM